MFLMIPALFVMMLTFALMPLVWLLQVAGEIVLPGWVILGLPALNMLATQIVIWTHADEKLDETGKRNVNRAVSLTLFAALALTGQVAPPETMPDVPLIGAWVPYALALLGWIWQGSQVVHDLLDIVKTAEPSPA